MNEENRKGLPPVFEHHPDVGGGIKTGDLGFPERERNPPRPEAEHAERKKD